MASWDEDEANSQKTLELVLSAENCRDLAYLLDKWRHENAKKKRKSNNT